MPRRNYPPNERKMNRSKRARRTLKDVLFARSQGAHLMLMTGHPSHVSWRPNRNGNRRYKRLLRK